MTTAAVYKTNETYSEVSCVHVQVKKLEHGQDLPLPSYNTEHSAAIDLMAAIDEPIILAPNAFVSIPTGLSLGIPNGYEMQIRGRSGLAARQGISVTHGVGTIDADFRGEVKVLLINHGTEPLVVERGMRIAQAVVTPVPRIIWEEVEALSDTARGTGGLGSTGVK